MASAAEQIEGNKYIWSRSFPEADEYPLSNSLPLLVGIVGVYLLFVLKIGPDFMKNRQPYKLKNAILVYNAVQVILSGYFAYCTSIVLIKGGLFPKTCCEDDPEIRKDMLWAVFVYLLGKISELADTVFFVLRKKYNQVSFLHVYHHSSVVIGTWMIFKCAVNQTAVYGGFINSVVHVVMYFYYFMAALGPQYQKYLTWKKYITTFQLVQFVTVFGHQVVLLLYSKQCTHAIIGLIYVFCSTVLFYVLFSNFYKQSYKPEKTQKNAAQNGVERQAKDQKAE